ncbi:MAG TPA: hypothetical protein VGM77_06765 [Gemmatimonadales bacterium]|jgi:hypothetical protein
MIHLLALAVLMQGADYSVKADSRTILRPLDDVHQINAPIGEACRGQVRTGINLVQLEEQSAQPLGQRPKSADWNHRALELSCARAAAFAQHQLSAVGYLMPVGASLASGAIALADSVLADEPGNLVAARLLAVLGPVVAKVDSVAIIPSRLVQMRGELAGPTANVVYRAVRAGVSDSTVFRGCVSLLLAAADYFTARDCSRRALAAGADSTWHLIRLAYIAFHTADTVAGVQLFREAVAVAGDRASRAELGWHLNVRARTAGIHRAAIPLTILPLLSDSAANAWLGMSDSVERVAWVRTRLNAMQRAASEPLGRLLEIHFYSITYAWDTFWGCSQDYAYHVAIFKPSGEQVYRRGVVAPLPPCFPTFSPDLHPVRITANRYRLWGTSSGQPLTLVAYAMAVSSMAGSNDDRGSAIRYTLDFRERDATSNRWSDSAVQPRIPIIGPRKGFVQGIIDLPRPDGASDWTLAVNQDFTQRGIIDESQASIGHGPLVLSDVVIGDSAQHLVWMLGRDSVVLAPLGAVDRHAKLELFVQLQAAAAEPRLRTTIRVFRMQDGERDPTPVIQIATTGTAHAGINPIHRELDVKRLGRGFFQLQVEAAGATARATRTTELQVH